MINNVRLLFSTCAIFDDGTEMIVLVLFWLGLAIVVGVAAANRGRNGFGWFVLALAISPLLAGLLVLALRNLKPEQMKSQAATIEVAETKVCPKCAERVKKAASVCRFCQHQFSPVGQSNFVRSAPADSPIDPYALARSGQQAFRAQLAKLSTAELSKVAILGGMDPNGYTSGWSAADISCHILQTTMKQLREDGMLPSAA